MNLLIVTSNLPFPLNSGGNQAQFNAIDFLVKSGVNISIVFNLNAINSFDHLNELKKIWKDVSFYPYEWKKSNEKYESYFYRFIKKIFPKFVTTHRPFNFLDLGAAPEITSDLIYLVQNVIDKDNIDVVQIEFKQFLPLIYALPNSVKTIFIQHEIQFVRNKLLLESLEIQSLYQNFIYTKMKSDEVNAMNSFDLVVTLTDIDKSILIENGVHVQIESSPASISNELRLNNFQGSINQLVFIGGSAHFPNLQGLKWFLEEIWSEILDRNSKVHLNIIGKWNTSDIFHFEKKYRNINFLGFVEDMALYLESSIMIVPIQIGSGMRMKIVEAANYGCPFVSTTKGVEGLSFVDKIDCVIADDNHSFADSVIQLLEDKELQSKYSVNGKKVFESNYSFEILGLRRLQLLRSFLSS